MCMYIINYNGMLNNLFASSSHHHHRFMICMLRTYIYIALLFNFYEQKKIKAKIYQAQARPKTQF